MEISEALYNYSRSEYAFPPLITIITYLLLLLLNFFLYYRHMCSDVKLRNRLESLAQNLDRLRMNGAYLRQSESNTSKNSDSELDNSKFRFICLPKRPDWVYNFLNFKKIYRI
jgi:hypothetical protein